LVQLGKFEEFKSRKLEIVKKYDEVFSAVPKITLLKRDYNNTSFFNYVIKVACDRDKLISFLYRNGIDSGVHYRPNHLQPIFRKYNASLPVTELVWEKLITLPLFYELQDSQIDYIIEKVKEYLSNN
jgi:dTDP-4-amino-4,6-dideoxygalactose transaminase